jgi:hypothetical protein
MRKLGNRWHLRAHNASSVLRQGTAKVHLEGDGGCKKNAPNVLQHSGRSGSFVVGTIRCLFGGLPRSRRDFADFEWYRLKNYSRGRIAPVKPL